MGPRPPATEVSGERLDRGRDGRSRVLHEPVARDAERLGAPVRAGHRLGRDRGQRGAARPVLAQAAQVHLEDGRIVGGQRRGGVGGHGTGGCGHRSRSVADGSVGRVGRPRLRGGRATGRPSVPGIPRVRDRSRLPGSRRGRGRQDVQAARPRRRPAPRWPPRRDGPEAIASSIGNGTPSPLRSTASEDRATRRAYGRERTRIAQGRARQARAGREVHHGIEPTTGLRARHQVVSRRLEAGRRRRDAEHPRHDAPHVHVERRDRDTEPGRRDGPSGVRPDPRQRLQARRPSQAPDHRGPRRSPGPPRAKPAPAGCSRAPPTRPAAPASRRRPAPPATATDPRTAATSAPPARSRSAAT